MDWRDLRIALALDRHHTHLDAARSLRMDATTVGRRVAALEEALGIKLFVRAAEGWRATDAGRRVLAHAAKMADEARAAAREAELAEERVTGTVRITTLDEVANYLLIPRLAELRARHPDLVIDLRCTEQVLDLVAGHADIALRLLRPEEGAVRVRRLGTVEVGIFGTPRWEGDPRPDLVFLGSPERPMPSMRWLLELVPEGRVVLRTNSVPAAYEAIRRGVGVGTMATVSAGGLQRWGLDRFEHPLWRVVPEAIAETPRIRAVLDWLDEIGAEAGA